jgi:hypothetical protein
VGYSGGGVDLFLRKQNRLTLSYGTVAIDFKSAYTSIEIAGKAPTYARCAILEDLALWLCILQGRV